MISKALIKDFKRISRDIEVGIPLSLVECRKKATGETVYLICLNYPEPDNSEEIGIFPIAEMIVHPQSGTTKDAVDLYDPPIADGKFGLSEDMRLAERVKRDD